MPKKRKPSYLLHKPTGQARVRIDGKDHYLGLYGSQESRDHYDDVIAEWFASDGDVSRYTLTIDDLALLYLEHAKDYYRKDGEPTGEVHCIRAAMRLLIEFDGSCGLRNFGPRRFREFRDLLVSRKVKRANRTLSRQYINKCLRKIVRAFKWAAREELIPVSVYQALTTVDGLRKGRSKAREAPPVRPVEAAAVEAMKAHLAPPVRAMVELQQLTGMRPGEVVEMRPCDVTQRDRVECREHVFPPLSVVARVDRGSAM